MPGPGKKPRKLKLIEGNRGKRPIPDEPDWPESTETGPPSEVKSIARALQEWERIVPVVESVGLLTDAGRHTLAAYCVAVARMYEAAGIVFTEGLVVEQTMVTGETKWVRNPADVVLSDAIAQVRHLSGEFGFTPATAGKVSATKKPTRPKGAELVD